jgi:hypothetical protein
MKPNAVALLGLLLLSTSLPRVTAQSQDEKANSKAPIYKAGQVWTMGRDITVTILATEDVHKIGKVVHVRVDKIPLQSCGEVHLTRAIEHLAVTEKMMLKSGLVLSKDNADLPESSVEAYRKWEEQKKHQVAEVPLQEAIFSHGEVLGPMICNVVPSET